MYDVFLYTTPKNDGYLLEYDTRTSSHPDVPPLPSYLKRHVLRSKVKISDVTEEYDIWSSWGSERDSEFELPRKWIWERSGAVEPDWKHETLWPWGTMNGVIYDRRGVGMGRRLLVRKGERREYPGTLSIFVLGFILSTYSTRGKYTRYCTSGRIHSTPNTLGYSRRHARYCAYASISNGI